MLYFVKMIKKRRWFSEISSEIQTTQTDSAISWSNSDSDSESKEPPTKSKKNGNLTCEKKLKSWISVIPDQNITPSKKKVDRESSSVSPSHSCIESPVLSGVVKAEEESPVLVQTQQSPILSTRRSLLKKIRRRYYKLHDEKITQVIQDDLTTSSDLFVIVDSQTPPNHAMQQPTQVAISPAISQVSQNCNIDNFPSQHSSEIISDSNTSYSDVRLSLYHEPPPRKRRYKKGGLARQLKKALDVQNTSLAIWQHELFLSRSKGEEMQPYKGDGASLEIVFTMVKESTELGCTILECKMDKEDFDKVLYSFNQLEIENESFLIIMNNNVPINISFEVGSEYKLFPPYSVKTVKCDLSKQTLCFINTSRFVSV